MIRVCRKGLLLRSRSLVMALEKMRAVRINFTNVILDQKSLSRFLLYASSPTRRQSKQVKKPPMLYVFHLPNNKLAVGPLTIDGNIDLKNLFNRGDEKAKTEELAGGAVAVEYFPATRSYKATFFGISRFEQGRDQDQIEQNRLQAALCFQELLDLTGKVKKINNPEMIQNGIVIEFQLRVALL